MASRTAARVLVTDGHELAGLATSRSVGRGGFDVTVAVPAEHDARAVRASRWVGTVIDCPDPWEEAPAFEGWWKARLRSGEFAAMFPVSEASMVAAARVEDVSDASAARVVMPDAISRDVCLSKATATRAALAAGLRTPRTAYWYEGGVFDDAALADLAFPFIVKSDNAHTSVGTYRRGRAWVVSDKEQLRAVRHGLAGLTCTAIAQELIPGSGVSISVLAAGGVPVLEFGHRRIH